MNAYQREQFDAYSMAMTYLHACTPLQLEEIRDRAHPYLDLRKTIDLFTSQTFSETCTANCFRNRVSACCSKEGIVTFFGDVVLNVLLSSQEEIKALMKRLQQSNNGYKCIYLEERGCMWRLKPAVCEMFVCDAALKSASDLDNCAEQKWKRLRREEKRFRWPDDPHGAVLFEWLEAICLAAGQDSPLMYLHKSPGLLMVRKRACESR